MPKKHKYVRAICRAHHCGNYDKGFKNHCRALKGLVPDTHWACWAFMTEDRALKVDRQIASRIMEQDRARHEKKYKSSSELARAYQELKDLTEHYKGKEQENE